ncbi:MAG: hypothetical protein NC408_07915 [Candidatus Gastranaerophilales bacterium]|nr:hypothetical protein [Candidatus Gastranaerophilales bacterium]MCM1072579.1 hypothetical protein [Bacteroides sp.]
MNLRDDELWDELRYWAENPVTEEEQEMRNKEINDYVNAVLNKMYGE